MRWFFNAILIYRSPYNYRHTFFYFVRYVFLSMCISYFHDQRSEFESHHFTHLSFPFMFLGCTLLPYMIFDLGSIGCMFECFYFCFLNPILLAVFHSLEWDKLLIPMTVFQIVKEDYFKGIYRCAQIYPKFSMSIRHFSWNLYFLEERGRCVLITTKGNPVHNGGWNSKPQHFFSVISSPWDSYCFLLATDVVYISHISFHVVVFISCS